MANRRTKVDAVLEFLTENERGITPSVAQKRFHLYRLADSIHKLRKRGYDIVTFIEEGHDEFGRNTHARYVLKGWGNE